MAVTQALFVIGSVYLKGSMQNVDSLHGEEFHPIVYAFLREISAGPLLFLGAWWFVGECGVVWRRCVACRRHGMQLALPGTPTSSLLHPTLTCTTPPRRH